MLSFRRVLKTLPVTVEVLRSAGDGCAGLARHASSSWVRSDWYAAIVTNERICESDRMPAMVSTAITAKLRISTSLGGCFADLAVFAAGGREAVTAAPWTLVTGFAAGLAVGLGAAGFVSGFAAALSAGLGAGLPVSLPSAFDADFAAF